MKKYESAFEVYKMKSGWYWKLQAPNGEVVARGGEPFKSAANAKRSINKARKYFQLGKIVVK